MEESKEIKDLTLRLYDALVNVDQASIANAYSQQKGLLMIGSDPNEWWEDYDTIIKLLKTQFEELKGTTIHDADPQAFSEGTVGWVADKPNMKLPDGTKVPFRMTGVFHQEKGEWKVVQWHASMGVSNEEAIGQELTLE